MSFDAIKEKEKQKVKKPRKIQREIAKINQVYPVIGITEKGFVKLKLTYKQTYMAMLNTRKYDLATLDDNEASFVIDHYWSFLRRYGASIKEIFMNLPEENQNQQNYIKHKIERTTNRYHLESLQLELEKLKFIEKEYIKLASYLCVFGDTELELEENIKKVKVHNNLFHFEQVTEENVAKILQLLNNTGGIKYYGQKENG